MNINYPKLITGLLLIPIMVAIGLDGPWMVIPALIFLSAFSKKSKEDEDEKQQTSDVSDNTHENSKGLKSKLPLLLIASIFAINATDFNEYNIIEDGFQVYDVILPFPGTPNETKQNMGGDIIMANYVYSPNNSHLNYASIVYENLPEVENPTATILRGFTRGHNVLIEREVQIANVSGTYVKLDADTPRKATWNAVAFEYKGNVYVWMVTFEPQNAVGNEDEQFLSELQKIEFK